MFLVYKISCSEEKNSCLLQVKDDLKNFPISTIRFELIMESFDLLFSGKSGIQVWIMKVTRKDIFVNKKGKFLPYINV